MKGKETTPIRADFSAGGLSKQFPCVYLLTVRGRQGAWYYVGKTGTSNRTGTSSPYERLAKHLAKVGNTQSCIWDSDRLKRDDVDHAGICFIALPLDQAEVNVAEKWLHWRSSGWPSAAGRSLNKEKPPNTQPEILPALRRRLRDVFERKTGQRVCLA
jgi:hypothetical protein